MTGGPLAATKSCVPSDADLYSVAATPSTVAGPTLACSSLPAIVSLPLADGAALDELDGPEDADAVVPVPPPLVVEEQPATSTAQRTLASAAANDFRKAEPFQ